MKKENKIIFLLIILIGFILLIDGGVIFLNKGKKMEENSPYKEEEKKKIIIYREYLCKSNPETRSKNNSFYDYNREYIFRVLDNQIIYGLYKDRMKFKNQQELEQYLNNPNFNAGSFILNVDKDHLEITFEKNMLLEKPASEDMTYTDSYLQKIEKSGFNCQLLEEIN